MNPSEIFSLIKEGLVLVSGEVDWSEAQKVVLAAELSSKDGWTFEAAARALADNADSVFKDPIARAAGLAALNWALKLRAA